MASEPNVRLRRAGPGDTDRILELVRVSMGEGQAPRSRAYWEWKHERNPFGRSPCLLAEADGKPVGLRVFMRWRWRANGESRSAVRAVDTATHPDWRGRGIFRRLTLALVEEMRSEGVAFVFNTPNEKSRPGYLKMGWEQVGRVSLWVRPTGGMEAVGPLLRSLFRRSDDGGGRTAGGGGSPGETPELGVGGPADRLLDQPELEGFLEALPREPGRFATPRDRDYLAWRYASIPGFRYRALWSFRGDEGAALVFHLTERDGRRELRICEVLVGEGAASARLGRELLGHLVSPARSSSPAHLAAAMAGRGSPAQRLLLKCGFLPAPRSGPILTVRPLGCGRNGVDPVRRSHWELSIGDLELF